MGLISYMDINKALSLTQQNSKEKNMFSFEW